MIMKTSGLASAGLACLTTLAAALSPAVAEDSIFLKRDGVELGMGDALIEERSYHAKHHRKQQHHLLLGVLARCNQWADLN